MERSDRGTQLAGIGNPPCDPTAHATEVLLTVAGIERTDQVKAERRLVRTDNRPEFAGRTMQTWAAINGVIQAGKPVQNAYLRRS